MTVIRPVAPTLASHEYEPRPADGAIVADEQYGEPEVSIVMPCLNEEVAVGMCVEKARHWMAVQGFSGEVIVVDNGSTDRSAHFAREAGARVIHEPRRGYGRAYLTGLANARGHYIVMGDADDTYDFESLADLIRPIQDDGYDLVIGNRFKGGIAEGAMPWAHRYIGTPAINALMSMFTGASVSDSQSGMRAFTRAAYLRMGLRSEGMEFASEMVVRSSRKGLKMTEVPVPYRPRQGDSKLRTFHDGWRHLRYLLLSAPNVVFMAPGMLLVVLGLITAGISLAVPSGIEVGSVVWQPIFASTIFLVVGATALTLGILLKRHAVARGLTERDRWTDLYEKYFSLEVLLVVSATLILAGAVLDVVLFGAWISGGDVPRALPLAALAQTFLIVGANLALASFLAVMMEQSDAEAAVLSHGAAA